MDAPPTTEVEVDVPATPLAAPDDSTTATMEPAETTSTEMISAEMTAPALTAAEVSQVSDSLAIPQVRPQTTSTPTTPTTTTTTTTASLLATLVAVQPPAPQQQRKRTMVKKARAATAQPPVHLLSHTITPRQAAPVMKQSFHFPAPLTRPSTAHQQRTPPTHTVTKESTVMARYQRNGRTPKTGMHSAPLKRQTNLGRISDSTVLRDQDLLVPAQPKPLASRKYLEYEGEPLWTHGYATVQEQLLAMPGAPPRAASARPGTAVHVRSARNGSSQSTAGQRPRAKRHSNQKQDLHPADDTEEEDVEGSEDGNGLDKFIQELEGLDLDERDNPQEFNRSYDDAHSADTSTNTSPLQQRKANQLEHQRASATVRLRTQPLHISHPAPKYAHESAPVLPHKTRAKLLSAKSRVGSRLAASAAGATATTTTSGRPTTATSTPGFQTHAPSVAANPLLPRQHQLRMLSLPRPPTGFRQRGTTAHATSSSTPTKTILIHHQTVRDNTVHQHLQFEAVLLRRLRYVVSRERCTVDHLRLVTLLEEGEWDLQTRTLLVQQYFGDLECRDLEDVRKVIVSRLKEDQRQGEQQEELEGEQQEEPLNLEEEVEEREPPVVWKSREPLKSSVPFRVPDRPPQHGPKRIPEELMLILAEIDDDAPWLMDVLTTNKGKSAKYAKY